VAYRADIEIAVRGATQITNLQQQINTLAKGVNVLNKTLRSGTVASIDNFNKAVAQSDRVMRAAAQGTRVQKQAIDTYVRSTIAAEKAERSLQVAIERRRKELGLAAATPTGGGSRRGTGGRLGGAISGAVIGGSFPLLFGQGGGAAAGGAIGGLAGGLLGPGGSFAGSLLGTLLGDIASKGQQIKELGTDIGFSAEQTKELQSAFKLAGQEAEKFNDAVQNIRGLSLSIEEQANAIRLVSQLTETYGGRIDKTTNAFTSALESGKVTQATLNQLTSQGIPIQDELAKKYGVSRDAILAMAKDGQVSVQTLADVLVDMGNKGIQAGEKPKTAFEQFTIALGNTVTAVTNVANALLTVLAPAIDAIIQKATLALNALTETINTELLRTQIQGQTGKVISPETMQRIEKDAMGMAARRYPSEAKGRQLAAGSGVISPRAQQEFQILREQGIRNELQRFGYEQGILKAPKSAVSGEIGRITAPGQLPPSGGGGGGKSASDRAAEDAAREAARVAELVRARQLATIELQRQAVFSREIAQAEMDKDPILARQRQGQQELMRLGIQTAAELEKEKNSMAQLAIAREAQAKKALILLGIELDIAKIQKEQQTQIETLVEDLEHELKLKHAVTEQERTQLQIAYEMARLRKAMPFMTDETAALIERDKKRLAAPKIGSDLIRERIGTLQDEVAKLTDIGNIAISVADGIGTAFSQAFQGLISGSLSAEEALGSFFKSVGDMFVSMAAEIIAKQMTMIILQTILRALGAVGGGGGFSGNAAGFGGSFDAGIPSIGNTTSFAGVFGRAGGGPTAAGTPYLVGERGPELFVPGTSGGVMSNSDLRSAMNSQGGGAGSPVLNMSFESTTIGGVEYVSREQLEQAMAETRRAASRDGAQRGMTMTLDRIQNSSSTRRRVGI
jgi:tape measure domain-containing protein